MGGFIIFISEKVWTVDTNIKIKPEKKPKRVKIGSHLKPGPEVYALFRYKYAEAIPNKEELEVK